MYVRLYLIIRGKNIHIEEGIYEYTYYCPACYPCCSRWRTDCPLFFWKKGSEKTGRKAAQIEAAKQTVSMLVIDKKRLRIKESGLPQMVIDQTPKMMRRTKLPIVKAKIGPKISILIADEKIYEQIPVKKEVKADISGLYIVGVRGIRGHLDAPPAKKKGFFKRMFSKKD